MAMLWEPLILITAIAPPPDVAGAHIVSSVLNIFHHLSCDKCMKLMPTSDFRPLPLKVLNGKESIINFDLFRDISEYYL